MYVHVNIHKCHPLVQRINIYAFLFFKKNVYFVIKKNQFFEVEMSFKRTIVKKMSLGICCFWHCLENLAILSQQDEGVLLSQMNVD